MEFEDQEVRQMKLLVPTFNGTLYPEEVYRKEMEEFSETQTPVLIHETGGIRIVLGSHNYHDYDKPDVLIERQPNGWLISFAGNIPRSTPCRWQPTASIRPGRLRSIP